MSNAKDESVTLRYSVSRTHDDWTLSEEPVPESELHDLILILLQQLLAAWATRTATSAQVMRNRAVRWVKERPQIGLDPDLCVVSPRTPEGDDLESLCTWREGHTPPLIAIEVVSKSHPSKDYVVAPDKYAASGTRELWVFDPKLCGPRAHGGPVRLQLWVRDNDGNFERVYAGEGPVRSPAVGGWLFAVSEGERLRIAEDPEGTRWWKTPEETERAAKDAERAAKEAALARVAELEAELRRRS